MEERAVRQERIDGVTVLIVLPEFYNPDARGRRRRVEAAKFKATCSDIADRFGGCVLHEDPKVGYWQKAGVVFEDEVVLVEVDMSDAAEEKQWLVDYARSVLVKRFEQKAIYLKFVRFVEVEIVEARR